MGRGGCHLSLGHSALTLSSLTALVVVAALASSSARAEEDRDDEADRRVPLEEVAGALADCQRRLHAHDERAARCYRDLAEHARTPPEDAAVAAALADVASDLSAPALVADAAPNDAVSVSALVDSGAPELVLSSAAYGGVAGFLGVATALSLTRISETDSLPWLVGAPALGILAGGAAAAAAAYALPLEAGDAALVSSSLWTGTAWGFALQLLVFDQRDDVGHVPLRFATILGSGLALGSFGAAASWGLELDPGDVGLMNSAAFWGPLLGGLTWLTIGTSGAIVVEPGSPVASFSTFVSIVLASSILPWSALFALHPFLDVERTATWLIEGGGAAGFLAGLSLMVFFSSAGLPTFAYPTMLTAMTAVGVAGGAALSFLVSDSLRDIGFGDLTAPLLSLSPALLPPAPGRQELAPALLAVARF